MSKSTSSPIITLTVNSVDSVGPRFKLIHLPSSVLAPESVDKNPSTDEVAGLGDKTSLALIVPSAAFPIFHAVAFRVNVESVLMTASSGNPSNCGRIIVLVTDSKVSTLSESKLSVPS
ncbi:MAG: Uncharacterised protein [Methanobacteriota archaeon]|nr:MAG: Uncharacterised protein [Euryarchaeota archaeon]